VADSHTDDVLIYTGGATERIITEKQWQAAGVEDQGEVVFDAKNNYRMPLDELTGKAAELLLKGHPREFCKNRLTIPAPSGE
jgi:hypothetical protein